MFHSKIDHHEAIKYNAYIETHTHTHKYMSVANSSWAKSQTRYTNIFFFTLQSTKKHKYDSVQVLDVKYTDNIRTGSQIRTVLMTLSYNLDHPTFSHLLSRLMTPLHASVAQDSNL